MAKPAPESVPLPASRSSLDDVLRLHATLAAGSRGLAPSPQSGLTPEVFRASDQDGDGLLSREEFVVGHHKQILDSGGAPSADLAAEATRLLALGRARRALASQSKATDQPRPELESVPLGRNGRTPALSMRTLVPGAPPATPEAGAQRDRVGERAESQGAPTVGEGLDRADGRGAAPLAQSSADRPVRLPEPTGERRGAPMPSPPTKAGRPPAGERPVIVAPPAPEPRPRRP